MKQWIIDRHNKGQDKYEVFLDNSLKRYIITEKNVDNNNKNFTYLVEYDFLFNPEWGFAKAFVETMNKEQKMTLAYGIYQGEILTLVQVFKKQMAIADDPLKYLEQFK